MSDVPTPPIFKLTPEAKRELEGLSVRIKQAEKVLASMKEMDMDTSQLEAELAHHKKIRDVLLRDFT